MTDTALNGPSHPPSPSARTVRPARETAAAPARGVTLPPDLADLARRLALQIAAEVRDVHADDRVPGIGETLRLLSIHHGDLPTPHDDLTRRRLAALRRILAQDTRA